MVRTAVPARKKPRRKKNYMAHVVSFSRPNFSLSEELQVEATNPTFAGMKEHTKGMKEQMKDMKLLEVYFNIAWDAKGQALQTVPTVHGARQIQFRCFLTSSRRELNDIQRDLMGNLQAQD
ncbi:hypothetical protein NDU88_002157 [Pleurodeles waltl]|uniref:Uncharacterized protein n=1 Tax=Pleurodeles waltl TaxID=8319 RepID=A0AAV7SDI3_PLEWA|nr:hypothetical protein NDU88_002157 [Pleurodeles waltl]